MLYKKYAKDGNVAVVEIDESNGEVSDIQVTHNITNTNMGTLDSPNLNADAYPILSGQRSFAKYQRFHITDLGGSTSVRGLKVWRTGALGGSAEHKTNARTSDYAGATDYAEPSASEVSVASQDMPTTEPDSANLGIGGSLDGVFDANDTYSDYLIHQLVIGDSDVGGSTSTMNYQYDELA